MVASCFRCPQLLGSSGLVFAPGFFPLSLSLLIEVVLLAFEADFGSVGSCFLGVSLLVLQDLGLLVVMWWV